MQHVVTAIEMAGLLDRRDIGGFLHHANLALVAGGAGTINARINIGNIVADGAEAQAGFHIAHGSGQRLGIVVAGAQNVKREPLRGLAADARQFLQLVNKARHRLSKSRHRKLYNRVVA